ncbi:hypothetical protein [Kitasatospora sp. NPDC058190]|uniref:hypothetical protein n=1 Tax=Kitasatospora sp. NPDC058190 TaxID=3346371 RepID=UPI0036D773F9
MNEPDVDGHRLSATFEQAMHGVGPDLGPLIAAGAQQGRSIRRRRRLTVAAAVTAVAALAVGGSVALRAGGGASATVAAASASPSASPSPSSAAATPDKKDPQPVRESDDGAEQPLPGNGPNAGKVGLTGHATLLTLSRALPANGRTSGYAGYSQTVGWTGPERKDVMVRARLTYDDGTGPAEVGIVVEGGIGAQFRPGSHPVGPGSDPHIIGYDDYFSCDKLNATGQLRSCSGSVLPDGSHLVLTERAVGATVSRNASLLRPDNTKVTVTASNTRLITYQGGPVVLRDGLPLTLDQLKAAVMATGYQEWITPEEAKQAEQTIRPFHDDTPERNMPSPLPTATPVTKPADQG